MSDGKTARTWMAAALLGGLGFVANALPLHLFFGVAVIFGSVFTLFATVRYGILPGIVATLIASSYTVHLWGHPYALIIFLAETVFVGLLWRKKLHDLILADAAFWFTIGMLLVYCFYRGAMGMENTAAVLIMLKQTVNGILNAFLASLFLLLLPKTGLLRRSQTPPLEQWLSLPVAALVLIPCVLLLVFEGRRELKNMETLVAQRLELSIKNASEQIEHIYSRRVSAVKRLAEIAATRPQLSSPDDDLQERLRMVKSLFPEFHNLYIADATGTTVAFYPETNEKGESTLGINFGDRPYFIELTNTFRPVISHVFLGRGGIFEPIQTINVPILSGDRFLGFASGALNLKSIAEVLKSQMTVGNVRLTLLDPGDRVIASSDPEIVPFTRSDFDPARLSSTETGQLWLFTPSKSGAQMLRFQRTLYVEHAIISPELPWRIIADAPVAPFQTALYRAYIDNMAVALFIGAVFFILGRVLVRYLSGFFMGLASASSDLPRKVTNDIPLSWPSVPVLEVRNLLENLKEMASAMRASFLEQQAHATRLAQTNEELNKEIAQRRASEEKLRQSGQFLREQNEVLLELARTRETGSANLELQYHRITEAAARTLGVDRVSIWFFDSARTRIQCHDLFELSSNSHTRGQELLAARYPQYFDALLQERVIAAHEACTDARTQEFAKDYLQPLGITAMLDAPVWMRGKMVGVICHEHMGSPRQWSTEEEVFAGALADVLALTLEEHERWTAQEALARSEESYRRIIETAREGIWLVDADYRTTYVNSRMAELFGYAPGEMLNRTVLEFVFEEDRPGLLQRIQERKSGKSGHYDFRYRRKDGTELWVISSTSPILGENGEFKGALGMFTDITDRRLAEQERNRLLERERQARREAEILHESGRKLAGELELERLLQIITEAGADICRAQRGILFSRSPTAREARPLIYFSSEESPLILDSIPDGELLEIAQALSECVESVRVERIEQGPPAVTAPIQKLSPGLPVGSYMIVPIRSRSGVMLATLLFLHEQPSHFSAVEERLVISVAAQAAIAMDNALLFQNAREELERRKRTEGELLRREKELQHQSRLTGTIIDNASACLFLLDSEGKCTFLNVAAEQATEYSLTEAQNRELHALVHPGCDRGTECIFQRLPQFQERVVREDVFWGKSGRTFPVSLSCSPIKREGVSVGFVLEVRDVTEEKRARAALLDAQQKLQAHAVELEQRVEERTGKLKEAIAQMEAFSYTISHDLRAPLRAMAGYADILEEEIGANLEPELRDYLQRISASALRLDKLIHDVLTYSRISRADLHLEKIDIERLVEDIVAQYPDLRNSRFEVERPLLPVLGNEALLTQCLSNLFVNAVKFAKANTTPEVRIRTELHGRTVRLWVVDNGIGIDPAHHEKIFGIFERIHNSHQYEGTGIGLAIVQKAVERMGGKVGLQSNLGQGSAFWIELRPATSLQVNLNS